VDSCGIKRPAMVHDDVSDEDVAASVDPFAVAVMSELGCDLSRTDRRPSATWRTPPSTWWCR